MTHRPEHDFWMTHPDDPDYLPPADRWCRVCALPDSDPIHGDKEGTMPADDTLLGQGLVDERHEARRAATRGDVSSYADEHECGQLRLAVPGEQVSLLPLPDSLIPVSGRLMYDDWSAGLVCTCTEHVYFDEDGDPLHADYEPTVTADRVCSRCGASASEPGDA